MNSYAYPPNKNPDPDNYTMSEKGWALKPRQCVICKGLFTPADMSQTSCDCILPGNSHKRKVALIRQRIYASLRGENSELLNRYKNVYLKLTGIPFTKKERENDTGNNDDSVQSDCSVTC